jgi:DMSO/TMAO reductase YedYZ heme-binding membrane subunit/nitrite reductase/ring-hydroxylating ferredoxin subunit
VYDAVVVGAALLYLAVFIIAGLLLWSGDDAAHPVTLLMRATSSCAIILLTVILAIGPLARLSAAFNPLLYNRRHLGVVTFLIMLVHGGTAIFWYHGFGVVNPIVSVFTSNSNYTSLAGFPYQPLGAAALVIFFLMAATSHDFWLKNLTPGVWKSLHMLVYVAFGLVVMHVTLGFLQDSVSVVYAALLSAAVVMIVTLHLIVGVREWRRDARDDGGATDGPWVDIGPVGAIPQDRAKVVKIQGCERIAVFRYDGKVSAVGNVCAHQHGPLGEGKIVDGCITCPWHGYQYLPGNGQSPPPFTEKVPTYRVRVVAGRVMLDPHANPPGTPVEPAPVDGSAL